MRVGLISMDQAWHDKATNFDRCAEHVAAAVAQGCGLVVFPEMTLTGYSIDVDAIAEPRDDSDSLRRFGALAKEQGVTIIFGACLVDPVTNRPRNELCVARPDGSSRAVYAKIHPFSFAREDAVLEGGDQPAATTVGDLTVGTTICYDLRFPELYTTLASQCHAAVVIASWPARREAHWRALLVARAIENQFYMFGVNRTGTDGHGLEYPRSSIAVSPEGEVLAPAWSSGELDVFEVDPARTMAYRRDFPTLRDRRPALYARERVHVDVA